MADQRITQLTALAKANVAATDVLPIADVSASETKKVTAKDLVDAGLDLVDASSIDLAKLDQASATKLGSSALATGAVTAAKLAADSSIAVDTTAPVTDNFEGRGYYNSSSGVLQVYSAGSFANVNATVGTGAVGTAQLADGAVTTAKASNLGTAAIADDAITYAKIQNTTATNVLLGRSTAGAGNVEEVSCTAAGRALLDDADATAQRATLGLGTLATQNGTFSGTFSGTSSGTNTGDQTITLTGDVTGSGTGSFAATIANDAVTAGKIASNAVTTAKVADNAITGVKLADGSTVVVTNATPSGSGDFTGQQWLNTATGIEYTWNGSSWQRQAAVNTLAFTDASPLAFAVTYPDNFSASVSVTLDTQAANRVFVGPTTGADATPTFRALVPGDLPDATVSTKGIIQPGTGLAVSSGTLNHSNSVATGTYTKVTVDAQGHVSAGAILAATDIPVLDASKITTGTFGTAFLGADAVTGAQLSDYSTAQIGEALPVADYIGQFFFNPLDKNIYLWDGNVWQPVGVSLGELIFAGTYDANLNDVLTVTSTGAAVGLTVGNPLPVASSTLTSYYVVVAEAGTGVAPAPVEALAPPDIILCDGSAWTQIDVSSTYTAQTATNVGFTPAGTIAATNVQGAIEEVATEAANATNLTSGTVAVARGGTGNTSYAKGDLLAATGATALGKLTAGTNGFVLRANSATATGLEWGTDYVGTVTNVTGSGAISVATGTTTPAISVASASTSVAGVVQLSDSTSTTSSTVAATSTAVKSAYDLAAAALPLAGGTVTGNINLDTSVSLVFEGTTANDFETTLSATDPTADRTINLPDSSGTLVLSGAIVNADINASAAIAGTKISPDFGSQNITTTGRVLTGTSTALTNVYAIGTALTPAVQIEGSTGNGAALSITRHSSAAANLLLQRGVTGTPVADTEALGQVGFNGFDGTNYFNAALIRAVVDGTPSTGSMPGRLSLQTTPSGSTTPVERLRLTPVGRVQVTGAYDTNTTAVSALDIDCSTANYFTKTINGNSTFTVSSVPASRAYSFTLELTHTSGTVTWFSGVEWPSGTAPTLTTGKTHLFMFVTDDGGTRWRASSLINYTN